ncbi:MAG TPA: carboxypeptidase-like regulatory domain-containing protein, partial [Candidatus Angelobacter sp.]|nr:carboxypeptidase-like regulatory domain-containing protein [Candidatus Angelobacter sp.]
MRARHIHPGDFGGIQRRLLKFVAIAGICFLAVVSASAQVTTADVLGTVTDNSGAVVPNAKVTITNTATNEPRSGQTGSSGDYVFTFLN